MAMHPLESFEAELGLWLQYADSETEVSYRFRNHFHPFVGFLVERLNQGELKDLLSIETQEKREVFFEDAYTANPNDQAIEVSGEDKVVDLAVSGPYSIYNWELFFHIPLTTAVQLSKNQRFAEAQRWFHFIFDPTTDEGELPDNPEGRYWKFRVFRETTPDQITDLLEKLAGSAGDDEVEEAIAELRLSIAEWRKTPFSPHTVAAYRPLAYQYHVVMKYLDNLIAWGDSLFRQFTIETINEAMQLYVLAANILGDQPREVPRVTKRPARTYKELRDRLDELGNALVEVETDLSLYSNVPGTIGSGESSSRASSLQETTKELFFCVPRNDQLAAYWTTVSDRLYKIRHCMDIEGNVRPLPLFQPPIDLGLLVKAAAAGLDLSSVVAGIGQPVSNVRFVVIVQKALEICAELKSLGGALLSALEKGDAERLTLIRQEHEIRILQLTQDVRYLQWKDAEAATEALLASRASAYQRYRHYQLLLGKEESGFSDLETLTLDRTELTEETFDDLYAELVNQVASEVDLEEYRRGDGEASIDEDSSNELALSQEEHQDLNVLMPSALDQSKTSQAMSAHALQLAIVPQFEAAGEPVGVGAATGFGGVQLSGFADRLAQLIRQGSDISNAKAARAAKLASYQRRIEDWVLQNNLASRELQQIGRQIVASLIQEQAAKKDYENHKKQIEQSQAIDEFLRDEKFTNENLYLWMQGEISKTYYDCYQLAFDTAKKAETTLKRELMRDEVTERDFVQFNYWDTGRKGLLSGESLFLDLKRMELAYLESNKREFELTKHISLCQLNPLALLQLKATGTCQVELPEWLFDLDCPGHYMRRIKSVGLSIPSIVGPHTNVNCTVSLQKSSIRTSALLDDSDDYVRREGEDLRFQDYYGAIQSVVTSSGQNDSGMFEVNLRDERFLPFENSGAISTWTLALPAELRQFDYESISDVHFHLRYTARQGGSLLADGAVGALQAMIAQEGGKDSELHRLFSLKYDFPTEWYHFESSTEGDFSIVLTKNHFRYLVSASSILFDESETRLYEIKNGNTLGSVLDPVPELPVGIENGEATVTLKRADIEGKEDLFLLIRYYVG